MSTIIHEIDGIKLINCCPHKLVFRNKAGEDITVPESGYTLRADVTEKIVGRYSNGLTFVEATFIPSEQGTNEIDELEAKYPEVDVFVGSIISAQAFRGRVVTMAPTEDTVRAAPQDKRYRADKFTIFN